MTRWIPRLRSVTPVRAGAAILTVAALVFAAHYVRRGYQQCHPARVRVSDAEAQRAKLGFSKLSEMELQTADGMRLKTWYVPPRNGAAIVLVPGLGGNRASLLEEALLFDRHGYGVLLLEPRAHGDSGGTTATWGHLEADDVVRAVQLAYAQPGVSSVGALGFSVGASAVALAAVREPSIHAVILYATWTSLREEIAYKARRRGRLAAFFITKGYELSGVDVDAVSPVVQLHRISPRPVLLLSGGLDTDTPPSVMDRVMGACGEPSELWKLPSAGHGGYLQAAPEEYERRVMGFWESVLAKTAVPP